MNHDVTQPEHMQPRALAANGPGQNSAESLVLVICYIVTYIGYIHEVKIQSAEQNLEVGSGSL